MKVLACLSAKGGVGKTTAAVNLAYEASRTGARVLLWDLDSQGAASYLCRTDPSFRGGAKRLASSDGDLARIIRGTDHEGFDLIPSDFSLRRLDIRLDRAKHSTRRLRDLLDGVADRYDIALVDCAPGLTLTSEAVIRACDALLVPTVPTPLSERSLEQLLTFVREHEPSVRVLPFASMVARTRLHRDQLRVLQETVPDFLGSVIPSSAAIERTASERNPVGFAHPRSPGADAFGRLWAEIADRLAASTA